MTNIALTVDFAARQYRLAVVAVLLSSSLNSVGGLLFRSLESASAWQVIFFRSGGLAVALSLVIVWQQRGAVLPALLRIGAWGLLGGIVIGSANTFFILSLNHTRVANTLFILGAVPFFTALLAQVFLAEQVRRATWAAMALSLVGIGIMLGDGLATGTFLGNALALICALCFASYVVILRHRRSINMLPTAVLGALLAATNAAFLSRFELAIPVLDMTTCVLWGGVLSCFVHVMFIFGSRYILGAELSLMVLLEFILGPLWVWLFFNEQPSHLSLLGGSLVLLAVFSRALAGIRLKRKIG